MKMDIQTFEPFAILGGKQFFKQLKVRLVFLEWAEMKQALIPQSSQYRGQDYINSIEGAFNFLLDEMKYEVRSLKNTQILSWETRQNWPGDIILAQSGYWFGKAKIIGQL